MSTENISISEAELEIMKVLWKENEPVSTHIINKAVEHKNWKRTTISTLLARLVEKKAVSIEKRGNLYYYEALISSKVYRKTQVRNLIKNLYDGSVKAFAVSLFEDEKLSENDIKELKSIFDDKEV